MSPAPSSSVPPPASPTVSMSLLRGPDRRPVTVVLTAPEVDSGTRRDVDLGNHPAGLWILLADLVDVRRGAGGHPMRAHSFGAIVTVFLKRRAARPALAHPGNRDRALAQSRALASFSDSHYSKGAPARRRRQTFRPPPRGSRVQARS